MMQAFRGLVGRAYRGVNAHDQVPALPPLGEYRHVGYGIWIDNGEPLLQVAQISWPLQQILNAPSCHASEVFSTGWLIMRAELALKL